VPNTTTNQDRTVCTKGSDHIAVADTPDYCRVPEDNSVQPFPNQVATTELKAGATWRTFIDQQKVWTRAGLLGPPSDPAHAGVNGGVNSNTYRGEASAYEYSPDVYAEGDQLVRCYDRTNQNNENTRGTVLYDVKKLFKEAGLKLPKQCRFLYPDKATFGSNASDKKYERLRGMAPRPTVPDPTEGDYPFREVDPATNKLQENGTNINPQPAKIYTVDINGRALRIIVPESGTSLELGSGQSTRLFTPTVPQIVSSLQLLDRSVLDQIDNVIVSPIRKPGDGDTRAGADTSQRTITFFPLTNNPGQRGVHAMTIHEGGHAFAQSQRFYVPGEGTLTNKWKAAMEADRMRPSQYACETMGEDFAEAYLMYKLTKGTPCEDYARYLYPNRYRVLDETFATPPAPAPAPGGTP
jgi:Domain of unknown function (DUF4150)